MKKNSMLLGAVFLFFTAYSFAQTAEEIVSKYQTRIFTMERVKSLQVKAKIRMAGAEFETVITNVSDGRRRVVFHISAFDIVQVYDGKEGWQINPAVGKDPVKMDDAETENIKEDQFSDDFYDYKKKGKRIVFDGAAEVDHIKCYKVELITPKGKVDGKDVYFFDAVTYLPVMVVSYEKDDLGNVREMFNYLNDYRDVGGFMVPFYQELKVNGESQSTLTLEKAEVNVPVDDSMFTLAKK
jgi:hypothetical protein